MPATQNKTGYTSILLHGFIPRPRPQRRGRGLKTRLDTPNTLQTYLQVTGCVNAKKTDVTLYVGNVSLDGKKCIAFTKC